MIGAVRFGNAAWKAATGNGTTASWAGKVDRAGTHIQGTWQLAFSDGDTLHGNFTATKQ
jgi:hypothetical protein